MTVIGHTIVGTMMCHLLCSGVYKCTWMKYRTLTVEERCKVDKHFGTAIAAVVSFVFALEALFDTHFHQITLDGSSAAGNTALSVTIGHYLPDLLYQKMINGTFGSIRNVGYHLAAIGGSAVGYCFFHRLFVYRIIHHISIPIVTIYDLMRKLNCDTRGRLFTCVMYVNLYFCLILIVAIPIHWIWCIYEIVTYRNEYSYIPLFAWIAMIAANIVTDYFNCEWVKRSMKSIQKVIKDLVIEELNRG